jgi:hypothetical protein
VTENVSVEVLLHLHARIKIVEYRRAFPVLNLGYMFYSFAAGNKTPPYHEYLEPWFATFDPPKPKRSENAKYSPEFIKSFMFAYEKKLISNQHMAWLGYQELKDSGAEI